MQSWNYFHRSTWFTWSRFVITFNLTHVRVVRTCHFSYAEYNLFYRALLQKRHTIVRTPLNSQTSWKWLQKVLTTLSCWKWLQKVLCNHFQVVKTFCNHFQLDRVVRTCNHLQHDRVVTTCNMTEFATWQSNMTELATWQSATWQS